MIVIHVDKTLRYSIVLRNMKNWKLMFAKCAKMKSREINGIV
jgi:hypothetical protein